jgi:HSP20 family protein
MNRRKEYRDDFEDLFDEWARRFMPRFPHTEMFDEIYDSFAKMQRRMNKLIADASSGKMPSPSEGGPYVYGWTFKMGPDGRPEFKEFGNVGELAESAPKEMLGSREPLVDINETDDSLTVTAEVPGISKEDINLDISEGSLLINVDTKERKYYKEIDLPEGVNPDSADATYNNGVLEVKFKKEKPKKGKRIKIN